MLKGSKRRLAVLSVSAAAVLAGGAGAAMATSAGLHWTKGANQAWAASSPKTTFTSSIITISCTKNTAGGNSVGSGPDIGFLAMNAPQFKTCKDSLGGTDTVTTKASGWKVAFYWNKTNSHCPAGTGGGKATHCVVIEVPKDGATITVGGAGGCKLTVQPNGAGYVGASATAPGGTTKDKFTITSQSVAYSGCGASGTAKFSGTYTLSKPNNGVLTAS